MARCIISPGTWYYDKACSLVNGTLKYEDGLNRLVEVLLRRADRAEQNNPCRMKIECLLTGRCPNDPVCNN